MLRKASDDLWKQGNKKEVDVKKPVSIDGVETFHSLIFSGGFQKAHCI